MPQGAVAKVTLLGRAPSRCRPSRRRGGRPIVRPSRRPLGCPGRPRPRIRRRTLGGTESPRPMGLTRQYEQSSHEATLLDARRAPCRTETDPKVPGVPPDPTKGDSSHPQLCIPTLHSPEDDAPVWLSAELPVTTGHFDEHFGNDSWATQDMRATFDPPCSLSHGLTTQISQPRPLAQIMHLPKVRHRATQDQATVPPAAPQRCD